MRKTTVSDETLRKGEEFERIGQIAVHEAQEVNRRLGIPNVYSINGILYYELPNGELSREDPYPQAKRSGEQREIAPMHFFTGLECEEWLSGRNRELPERAMKPPAIRLNYPEKLYRIYPWAHWIATSLSYYRECLLWIKEWDIFSSTENLHLYYRLRQSYHDYRMLHEAPGHLFLKHESEDLASFLQIAMLNGWGGFVLGDYDYVNLFFSHDEFIDFYTDEVSLVDQIKSNLSDGVPNNKRD